MLKILVQWRSALKWFLKSHSFNQTFHHLTTNLNIFLTVFERGTIIYQVFICHLNYPSIQLAIIEGFMFFWMKSGGRNFSERFKSIWEGRFYNGSTVVKIMALMRIYRGWATHSTWCPFQGPQLVGLSQQKVSINSVTHSDGTIV